VNSERTVTALWLVLAAVVLGFLFLAGSTPATGPAVAAGSSIAAAVAASGWTSGWVGLTPGDSVVLHHGLGGDPSTYAVQLWFWETGLSFDPLGFNTRAYGGLDLSGDIHGAFWQKLDGADIEVHRYSGDTRTNRVRVWIWVPQETKRWCSPWTALAPGYLVTFNHNLGGNVDDYVVGLWFMDAEGDYGINQRAYGGLSSGDDWYGAWWENLDTTSVSVVRGPNDLYASSVRVCVSVPSEPPNYDSGWRDINPDQRLTLDHGLGGDLDRYIVRMEFKDKGPHNIGIHQQDAGGNVVNGNYRGVHWQNLTNEQIRVWRQPQDYQADQVRVRIWVRKDYGYLPIVERNN
jgi:hypothetical protein